MKIYEVREKDSSLLCARYGKEERKMKFAFLIMGDFHVGLSNGRTNRPQGCCGRFVFICIP